MTALQAKLISVKSNDITLTINGIKVDTINYDKLGNKQRLEIAKQIINIMPAKKRKTKQWQACYIIWKIFNKINKCMLTVSNQSCQIYNIHISVYYNTEYNLITINKFTIDGINIQFINSNSNFDSFDCFYFSIPSQKKFKNNDWYDDIVRDFWLYPKKRINIRDCFIFQKSDNNLLRVAKIIKERCQQRNNITY